MLPFSNGAPNASTRPSRLIGTARPKPELPPGPVGTTFEPSCAQVPADRVNRYAAPREELSAYAPMTGRSPAELIATLCPKRPAPVPPIGVNFEPCCVQFDPERVKTYAAPVWLLSFLAPMIAVVASAFRAPLTPNRGLAPPPPVARSFACWVQVDPERVNANTAPVPPLSDCAPARRLFPSALNATEMPKFTPDPVAPVGVSLGPC